MTLVHAASPLPMPRQTLITIVSVIAIFIGLVLLVRPLFTSDGPYGDNNANLPEGAWYQCTDGSSPHAFHLTVKELSDHFEANYGKPDSQPKCPTCGKSAQAAFKCASCGKMTPRTANTSQCAHCSKPFDEQ